MRLFFTALIILKVNCLFPFAIQKMAAQDANDEVKLFSAQLNRFLNVRDLTISQNGREVYFTIQSPNQEISQIACMKMGTKDWEEPTLMPFCDEYKYLEPFLTTDAKRLYFVSDRPLILSSNERKDFDIWYVERANEEDEWSGPFNLGSPVNSDLNEFFPSLSENNNLYITIESPSGYGKDDVYYCSWDGKNYSAPVLLDESINSNGYEFNAFISRDESFLIFTKYQTPDGFGSGDLYISKKGNDGKWQPAMNLGIPVNTKYMEYCPFYDESSETLYFTSKRNSIQSRKFNDISDFEQYINEGENGLSKIYQIKWKMK